MRITFIIAIAKFLRNVADGDHDWMDPEGGVQCQERLREAGNDKCTYYVVEKAGHHCKRSRSPIPREKSSLTDLFP